MRKTVSGVMLTLLLINMLMLTFNIQPLKAGTITVPDDYPTIQEAINNANKWDTIYVKAGTYYENVVVDKSVSLIGQNRINTIIDGSWQSDVVSITASNVTIANFTIMHASICGISLWENCSYSNIFENEITNNRVAVNLWYSSSNHIFGNTITTNERGINLTCSSNNNIFQNSIQNDTQHSICLGCCSDYNNIYQNDITDNDFGIQLYNSLNNCIYHNNFVNNLEQTIVNYANVWDDGYPSGGNYWSDYTGSDLYSGLYQNETGSDGVGDAAYVINELNIDHYPLMSLWTGQTSVAVPVKGGENATITSNVTIIKALVTKNTLHFEAYGPTGSTGWVNVTFPMINTTKIKVFINGTKLSPPPFPIITSNGTHYFIYFEFTLSKHNINIQYAIADITTANITQAKTVVGQGYTIRINAILQNQGDYEETFNVTAYANTTIIQTKTITLASKNSTMVSFVWNTTGFAYGNYTISAYAWPVFGETDTDDNSPTGKWVFVTIAGDVDGSRRVEMLDLWLIQKHYGARIGTPEYVANYDVDVSGRIEMLDMWIAQKHYREHW